MPSDVVRFGNGLELDRRAYELRRSGRPLKLERIPMELLLLLVERKGQLVTREEIIEKVWGKDLFFDTDNSINAAIRKIRQVLRMTRKSHSSSRRSPERDTDLSRLQSRCSHALKAIRGH